MTIPNAITIGRTLLIPVILYLLAVRNHAGAFVLFAIAATGDFVDGYIARRFGQTSRLGALLDPAADKATMLGVTAILAWQGLLPMWLAAAIIGRDLVIAGGVLAYRLRVGPVEMAPTLASKANTLLEFIAIAATLAQAGGVVDVATVLPPLYLLVLATVVASGVQYVWVWGHKAAESASTH